MTDAEIRKQLAEQYGQIQNGVFVDSPERGPILLLISHDRLTPETRWDLQERIERCYEGDRCALVLEKMDVYQLIDGVWNKLP